MNDDANLSDKPGWTTSEFWTTVGTMVTSFLVIAYTLFQVPPDQQGSLTAAVTTAVTALGGLAANAFVVWRYIHSRVEAKKQSTAARMQSQALSVTLMQGPPRVPDPLSRKTQDPNA